MEDAGGDTSRSKRAAFRADASDRDTVRASLTEPEQFEAIFDRYHSSIWSYLARVGGTGRADDLTGEVFVVAFGSRARYDPDRGAVRSWLYGIASNLLRTRLRSDARGMRAFGRLGNQRNPNEESFETVDTALTARQQLDAVTQAMAGMSPTDREILVLYAWQQLSYDDIAATLGIEIGTVRSRLARARARLRELVPMSGEVPDTSERSDWS